MSARTVARAYGVARVALGAGLLVAPRLLGRPWLGRTADEPGAQAALRALAARDVVLGGIVLHTVDHPEVGPRWLRTCAAVDAVDAAVTLLARGALPPAGSALVVATAVGGAATGAATSRALSTS